jgi:hypothetical protein
MNAKIDIEGAWYECEFSHPHQAAPIETTGPQGMRAWQPSPYARYNAKATMPLRGPVVHPGRYAVHDGKQSHQFQVEKCESSVLWGNVL